MFKTTVLFSLIAWGLLTAPLAYAGKVELTTYYPSPMGEYSALQSTILTLGYTGTTPQPGVLTFVGGASNPSGAAGSIYYNNTSGSENFKYTTDGTTWKNLGSGVSLGTSSLKSANTIYGPAASDGFVAAWVQINTTAKDGIIQGITCSSSSPLSDCAPIAVDSVQMNIVTTPAVKVYYGTVSFPVKKGNYWIVAISSSLTGFSNSSVNWTPLQ